MSRSVVTIIVVVVVVVLALSLLLFVKFSEEPHFALISESTAEEISGQNYTLASLTTSTGSGLPYAPYGNILVQGVSYTNATLVDSNGTPVNYFFQAYVLEFNTTIMAQKVYQLELINLEYGDIGAIHSIKNSTYNGFNYTYTTEPLKGNGLEFFWGAVGFSGNLVFLIRGQSSSPPKIGMSTVAIDQIDLMTAVHL